MENSNEGWITALAGVVLVVVFATLAITDIIPVPSYMVKHEGCSLVQSLKTDEYKYCGKACLMPLYVNTWRCGTKTKVLIETM